MASESFYIAHQRQSDGKAQTLDQHLYETASIAARVTSKIGLPEVGEILGLLHDFGKHGLQFQSYIGSATGRVDPDADGYVDATELKGQIDHSTAGAQWIWRRFSRYGKQGELCGQILALCLASHHSGLIDVLRTDGQNGFDIRMTKPDEKTHLSESTSAASRILLSRIEVLSDKTRLSLMLQKLRQLVGPQKNPHPVSETIRHFHLGLFTRFLFSALIDADRINSADFENPRNDSLRHTGVVDWDIAIDRMEKKLSGLSIHHPIDELRRDISQQCKNQARNAQGVYSLTVPTGGGKTYSSLRYALHHAKQHQLDHIIYVIPYTSIIEQNADAIREVIERPDDITPWVLEHHSNLEPEQQTWHSKLAAENWSAPIIFTTMVQFLESLFSGGTRGARRMHQLANSVIIFDEIQTLPVNCTHLFCNAINFLTTHTRTTVLLCTATQPLLDQLRAPDKGQLVIPPENELVENVTSLFEQLKRVDVRNRVRPKGWSTPEIHDLLLEQFEQQGNCLVIVNTKKWAKELYQLCRDEVEPDSMFHLSTHQCPAHRKKLLKQIRKRLDNQEPVLCISTQLIEAGVDVDFNCVIRFLAGLDSIAQSAGRCNRNGRLRTATVHIVNPENELIERMVDIKEGRDQALRILSEYHEGELLTPAVMSQYFRYYFFNRSSVMAYPLSARQVGQPDTLLNLLSNNPKNSAKEQPLRLRQSFMTAGKAFKAIDAPTESVIVPHDEGGEIIAALCGISIEFEAQRYHQLLKQAQKYSVNLFPNIFRKLQEQGAIYEIQPGEGIYYLDRCYYSDEFGLATEPVSTQDFLNY